MKNLPEIKPYIGKDLKLPPRPAYSSAQMREVKHWVKVLNQIRKEELENESQNKSVRDRSTHK